MVHQLNWTYGLINVRKKDVDETYKDRNQRQKFEVPACDRLCPEFLIEFENVPLSHLRHQKIPEYDSESEEADEIDTNKNGDGVVHKLIPSQWRGYSMLLINLVVFV
jgi:hypothetical protein